MQLTPETGSRGWSVKSGRDGAKADAFCREFRGTGSYSSYSAAIEDPRVEAVVVAVPPDVTADVIEAELVRFPDE